MDAVVQIPYRDVEVVDIGGPGLVKSGGGFSGGGFGVAGAVEGTAIAAVLNILTAQTAIKTIVRIQAAGCELFLLCTTTEPEALRIGLSRPLGAVVPSALSARQGRRPLLALTAALPRRCSTNSAGSPRCWRTAC
jgi:hypothetical protein